MNLERSLAVTAVMGARGGWEGTSSAVISTASARSRSGSTRATGPPSGSLCRGPGPPDGLEGLDRRGWREPDDCGSEPDRFSVALIPFTLAVTTLGTLAVGGKVNLETDILAKYVQRLVESQNWSPSETGLQFAIAIPHVA